jgi:hypothetical protein
MATEIRRDIPDVQPLNYERRPVQDTSFATTLEGVAKQAIQLDAALAERRFDKAQAMLQAQYVVGSPAAEALKEDSPSDKVPLSPEDDRSLRDFQSILNTQVNARDQGRMNYASYQLRAERLLRQAIAKRPGLAQEFRQIAASYVGGDVTGAESRYLADAERQMAQDAAAQAKQARDDKWKTYDDRIELLKQHGLGGYALFEGPDDPNFQEYWKNTAPILLQRMEAEQRVSMAENTVKLRNLQNDYRAPENAAVWIAKHEALRSQAAALPDNVRSSLRMNGLENDPQAMRQAMDQASEGIRRSLAEMEAEAVKYNIDPSLRQVYRQRGDELLARFDGLRAIKNDAEYMTAANDLLLATERNGMLNNEEYLRMQVFMRDMPQSVQQLVTAKMEKSMVLLAADILQDTASPELVAKQAPALLPQLVKAIYGGKGKDDPIATARFVSVAQKALVSYVSQPDQEFRAGAFTRSPTTDKPGTMQILHDHATLIVPTLTKDQQRDLTTVMAAATGNSFRVLNQGLYSKYPGLMGKVVLDFQAPNGQVFQLKPGVTLDQLSAVEKAGLIQYNRAAQADLLYRTLQAYSGGTRADVIRLVGENYSPGQALRQQEEARRRPAQPTQGGGSAPATRTAPARWWDVPGGNR